MTFGMGVHKRCAGSGRALHADRVCSKRTTICENTIVANFAKSKQRNSQKTVCGDEFATMLLC